MLLPVLRFNENSVAMSHELEEKNISSQISPRDDKISHFSVDESPVPGRTGVYRVNRNADKLLPESGEFIPGYDANLMQARAALSYEEEKKLLRRIDWHLIPLLAIMYMLKSVDFSNVSPLR